MAKDISRDNLAVFQLIFMDSLTHGHNDVGDRIPVLASVPYISASRSPYYPYVSATMTKDYQSVIKQKLDAFYRDMSDMSGVRHNSQPIDPRGKLPFDIANPVLEESAAYQSLMDNTESYERNQQINTIAKDITHRLSELRPIFEFLFSLTEKNINLLQIVTQELDIPWDWIYDENQQKLLCEVFGSGVTFPHSSPAEALVEEWLADRSLTRKNLIDSDYSALIIGNSYSSDGSKHLPIVADEVSKLKKLMEETFGRNSVYDETNIDRRHLTDILKKHANKLRLIYLTGHFEEKGFCTEDGDHLTVNDVHRIGKYKLTSSPIVFLNGCCSQFSCQCEAYKYERRSSLAEAFLKHGAVSCITTNTDIRANHAAQFADNFFRIYFQDDTSIGRALLETRKLMKKTSYEWASYHLLGDPTEVLIKSD